MFRDIENLKINNIHKGISKKSASVKNRKGSSFILRMTGKVRYTFSDYSIEVASGEIVFLPAGSSYLLETISDCESEYISILFESTLTDASPSSFPFDGFSDADEFINNLHSFWKFGGASDHYKCYSIFYNLLSYLHFLENQSYMNKKKLSIISPAISYLRAHVYDCDLKTETLYNICGISGTYFRKLFEARYSVSPQKYILSKRLSHAKAIIDNGDYGSIAEVSLSVGYSDPLYFSRAFKKKYGISPSQYAKS